MLGNLKWEPTRTFSVDYRTEHLEITDRKALWKPRK